MHNIIVLLFHIKYPHQKGSKEFVRTLMIIIKKFGSCLDVMGWASKR